MLGALALLGLGALALAPSPRRRGLGDTPLLPSGDAPSAPPPRAGEVWLLRPADFSHPSQRLVTEERAEAAGGPWVVTRPGSFEGKHFETAKAARNALKAAGFRGPYGRGTASRWSR